MKSYPLLPYHLATIALLNFSFSFWVFGKATHVWTSRTQNKPGLTKQSAHYASICSFLKKWNMESISSCNSSRQLKRSLWWKNSPSQLDKQLHGWKDLQICFPHHWSCSKDKMAAMVNTIFWTLSGKPIIALRKISKSLKVLKRCHSSPENEAKRLYVGLTISHKWKIPSGECPEDTKAS